MTFLRPSVALLGLAFLPLVALAGCSASSPATPSSAPSSTAAPAAAHSSAATPTHVTGSPITTADQLCSLATEAEATAALGASSPVVERNAVDSVVGGSTCEYATADLAPDVVVSLFKGGVLEQGDQYTAVAGLGDKAVVSDTDVEFSLGDTVLQILNLPSSGSADKAHLVAFAKLLASRY